MKATAPVLVKKSALAAPVRAAAPSQPKPAVSAALPKGAESARKTWAKLFGGAA